MKIIRPKQLPTKIGLSLTTVWRLEKAGNFPKRRKISSGAVGWLEEEVNAWLDGREVVV